MEKQPLLQNKRDKADELLENLYTKDPFMKEIGYSFGDNLIFKLDALEEVLNEGLMVEGRASWLALIFYINKYSTRVSKAWLLSSSQSPARSRSSKITIKSPVSMSLGRILRRKPAAL